MTRQFEWLGKLPPHHLGLAYTASACIGAAFRVYGQSVKEPGIIELGSVLLSIAIFALYVVVTWYRQDDALAAGVLLTVTVIVGTLAATTVTAILVYRSLTAGIAIVTYTPMIFLFWGIFLVPAFTAVVWIARRVSAVFDR